MHMPPKGKKKRASLKLDSTGEVQELTSVEAVAVEEKEPPVRQVVEVVEEDVVPEAIETIKKDAEEIAEAVEEIEEEVKEEEAAAPMPEHVPAPQVHEEPESSKGGVESLFVKSEPGINPEITVVGKKSTPLGVWVGAMLGVALAIGVSLILLVKGPSTLSFITPAKPTPTPQPTAVPTPSAAVLNRADVKIRVVNGGGTPGAGSKMKTFLEGKGYTVASVGNAEEYTFTETVITAKADKAAYVTLLTDDLKSDYSLGTSTASAVEADAAYDVLVTVGKE